MAAQAVLQILRRNIMKVSITLGGAAGHTNTYENVGSVEKVTCQGFKEDFYQLFSRDGKMINEVRASNVAQIVIN
jgi:hypothetical protein